MILEGLVTTTGDDGRPHLAPMGPAVDGTEFTRFTLRPFPTSTTFHNLCRHPEGVLHVVDNVLLLARAAIGQVDPFPEVVPAAGVRGFVLADACRWYEFRVTAVDRSAERVRIDAEVVATGRGRDFFGLNRAKHAVVEAAILATRVAILPKDQIVADLDRLAPLVTKTGGPSEAEAFALLRDYVRTFRRCD